MRRYRVVVWGTGFVGRAVLRDLLHHPAYDVVGVIVHELALVAADAAPHLPSEASGRHRGGTKRESEPLGSPDLVPPFDGGVIGLEAWLCRPRPSPGESHPISVEIRGM